MGNLILGMFAIDWEISRVALKRRFNRWFSVGLVGLSVSPRFFFYDDTSRGSWPSTYIYIYVYIYIDIHYIVDDTSIIDYYPFVSHQCFQLREYIHRLITSLYRYFKCINMVLGDSIHHLHMCIITFVYIIYTNVHIYLYIYTYICNYTHM